MNMKTKLSPKLDGRRGRRDVVALWRSSRVDRQRAGSADAPENTTPETSARCRRAFIRPARSRRSSSYSGRRKRRRHHDLRHQFRQHVQSGSGQDHLFEGHRRAGRPRHGDDAARPGGPGANGGIGLSTAATIRAGARNHRVEPVPAERASATAGGRHGELFLQHAHALWHLGERGGLWPLLAADGGGGQRGLAAVLRSRALGLYGCGWYWMSDYSWGWAPFHYGRWFHHARFGWCWMPDTVWGPSWVTWRYSDDYCGWAPLPPGAIYRAGVGFFLQRGGGQRRFRFRPGRELFSRLCRREISAIRIRGVITSRRGR